MNQEKQKIAKHIMDIVDQQALDYLKIPNITAVGFSEKFSGDRYTGEPCISIFVEKKLPKNEVKTTELIPATMHLGSFGNEVVATDVLESGVFTALAVHTKYTSPSRPGDSIGHHKITAGTLGAAVVDNITGQQAVLSNNHVLANQNNAKTGDIIHQPGPADPGSEKFGHLIRFIPINFNSPNRVDCALCDYRHRSIISVPYPNTPQPHPDTPAIGLLFAGSVNKTILNPIEQVLSILNISLLTPNAYVTAQLHDRVQKVGRTTGQTQGRVESIHTWVKVKFGVNEVIFKDQIIVVGDSAGQFSQGGDSGSMVIRKR